MTQDDSIDVREILRALWARVGWLAGGAVVGLALAATAIRLLPPRFEADATILLRSGQGQNPSVLARLGGLADLLPGQIGGMESGASTELEILTSRTVIGEVVDSLKLQARIREPLGLALDSVFSATRFDSRLESAVFRFDREGGEYRVRGPGFSGQATPGSPFRLPGGVVTLRSYGVPDRFRLELVDREDAVARVQKRLTGSVAAGDVAELVFRASDPSTAAAVPNSLVAAYLRRRTTTDRGVNQHRFEFLAAHTDSLANELIGAEQRLRAFQEATGVVDADLAGSMGLERAMAIKTELETIEVEARALGQILGQSGDESASAAQLAAYPTFLRNPAINTLLSSLLELQTDRVALLERRTEADEEVLQLTRSIEHLEQQLTLLSRSFLSGLLRQHEELEEELSGYRAELDLLPAHIEESLRQEREVRRLSETLLALQTQLVEARLAAISEGGDVRQIDTAVPPKKPDFPKPLVFLAIGLFGGLLTGGMGALGSIFLSDRIRDVRDAELAAGVPAMLFDPRRPLLLAADNTRGSLLIIPIGAAAGAAAIGNRIATTAALQGRKVALANLEPNEATKSGPLLPRPGLSEVSSGELPAADNAAMFPVYLGNGKGVSSTDVEELERQYPFLVAVLPTIEHASTAALLRPDRRVALVGQVGEVSRRELSELVTALDQMGVITCGVILYNRAIRVDSGP